MKGRKIFGGLEPWGEVWRVGANSTTKITFSTPVKLDGVAVPAGTYGLFALLGQNEWTIILNKNANQWGAYSYDAKDDVAHIKVTPVVNPYVVESFTIGIGDLRDESATLYFVWEKTRVPVKVEVDVVGTLVPQIEAAMSAPDPVTTDSDKPGQKKLNPNKPYVAAAMFYLDHNLDLQKAIGWMDTVIAAQPDAFYLVYRKALIQAKAGDKAGAIASATASREAALKDKRPALRDEYIRLNEALINSLR
jgi:hypothetical protein